MTFATTPGRAPIYTTAQHRRARRALLAAHTDGDPCCICHHPMTGPPRTLHADHCPDCLGLGCVTCDGAGYRGLAHGTRCPTCGNTCNQRDGAIRGRAKQDAGATRWIL